MAGSVVVMSVALPVPFRVERRGSPVSGSCIASPASVCFYRMASTAPTGLPSKIPHTYTHRGRYAYLEQRF